MKLRNKKTGEVFGGYSVSVNWFGNNDHEYHSLAELNEEWEDYKPAEPLIKDEKIRKAVRAFAELNNSATIIFELSYGKSSIIARADNGFAMLWVAGESWETNGKGIKWDEPYTIAELCGEDGE